MLTLNSGTGSSECAIANGCNHDFGPCWLPGENSFRPLSEVFAPATETSACPIALLPGPSDGTEIAQPPDTTDSVLPPPEQTSTDGQTVPVPIPVPTPRPGGPPKPPKPRLCFLCGKIKLPKWKLDLSCRGPLCKHIGPRRGCLGICDLFKCHVGCGKKGGGDISKTDKPKPDPGKLDLISYGYVHRLANFSQRILQALALILTMMSQKRQKRCRRRPQARRVLLLLLKPRVNARRP